MSHTYIHSDFHCIFSTKHRQRFLMEEHRRRLFPYMTATANAKGMRLLAVGGTEDHVHLLLSLPGTIPLSTGMQLIKGNTSHWLGKTFPELKEFAWQEGFAAFGVSASNVDAVREYIEHQEEHHTKRDFDEEFIALLKKHGIECDPKYVFG